MASGGLPGDARRVLVYGVTGSGKSVLAQRLAAITGIEWHCVDDLTWEPGWVPVPPDEQRRRIAQLCARADWILDSAYSGWLDIPLMHAELIVALDYPRWFSLQRLVRRTATRVVGGSEVCNGNRETVRRLATRDAIIAWHFRSFANKRRRMRAWCDDAVMPPVVRFTSPRETERWLRDIAADDTGQVA